MLRWRLVLGGGNNSADDPKEKLFGLFYKNEESMN